MGSLVNVSGGGEIIGVTADILLVRVLVHTDPVDLHRGRERKVFNIHETEVLRHAQVGNEILVRRKSE